MVGLAVDPMSIWPAALRRVTLPCIWNTVENPPFECRGLMAEAVRHRLAPAFTVFGGLRLPRCMNGFWHRLRTILIRNGLLETVANQHHQEFRGKGNAVIRSPTRHHVQRASDVLPSVQPRCFALQRPLFKRGWRCYAVQGRRSRLWESPIEIAPPILQPHLPCSRLLVAIDMARLRRIGKSGNVISLYRHPHWPPARKGAQFDLYEASVR
ncbi:hypothetical protein LA080_005572 [Diaporthe eres]|nr:hypothetical protein LA080_005572 [Diaporthe eres]